MSLLDPLLCGIPGSRPGATGRCLGGEEGFIGPFCQPLPSAEGNLRPLDARPGGGVEAGLPDRSG